MFPFNFRSLCLVAMFLEYLVSCLLWIMPFFQWAKFNPMCLPCVFSSRAHTTKEWVGTDFVQKSKDFDSVSIFVSELLKN